MQNLCAIEDGVYHIPLTLAPKLENQRETLQKALINAQRRICAFAAKHGWGEKVCESFADQAEIFATQTDFICTLRRLFKLGPEVELPETVVAALEFRTLMAVAPAEYRKIYPVGDEPAAFEKLLAHEIAHRLHVRILGGNEEAMGPVWFFEGFAIYAADQFPDAVLTREELEQTLRETSRGSYVKYSAAIRFLLRRFTLQELVARAHEPEFTAGMLKTL